MSTLDTESIDMLSKGLVNLSKKQMATIIYVSHSMVNKRLNDNSSIVYIDEGELMWQS